MSTRLQSSRSGVSATVGLVLAAFAGNGFAQSAYPFTCNALVAAKNDLYLTSQSGQIQTAFTSDGQPKLYSALSPDSKRVSYVLASAPMNIVVRNATAQEAVLSAQTLSTSGVLPSNAPPLGALMSLSWPTSGILAFSRYYYRSEQLYVYSPFPDNAPVTASIPTTLTTTPLPTTSVLSALGQSCDLNPLTLQPACIRGNDVDVAGQNVYFNNGFDTGPVTQVTLASGATTSIGVDAIFQVSIIAVTRNQLSNSIDTVTIKVTNPDGNSSQSILSVATGTAPLAVPYDGDTYGFLPRVINDQQAVFSVGEFYQLDRSLDPAIAWLAELEATPSLGTIFALFRHDDLEGEAPGKPRSVVGISPLHVAGATLISAQWQEVESAASPIIGPVIRARSINGMLLVETADQYYLMAPSSIPGNLLLEITPLATLPKSMSLSINNVSVAGTVTDWACTTATSFQ